MVKENDFLDLVLDCDECIKDIDGYVSVWKLKDGRYAVCLYEWFNKYKVFYIYNSAEFAINNAFWYASIL